VVVADDGAAVAEVVNADKAVRACALAHISDKRRAIGSAPRALGRISCGRSDPELDVRFVEVLPQEIAEAVQLIPEFEVMRAMPSGFVPGQIAVNLIALLAFRVVKLALWQRLRILAPFAKRGRVAQWAYTTLRVARMTQFLETTKTAR